MKNFTILFIISFLFSSCAYISDLTIIHQKSKECPAINSASIPAIVVQSFQKSYPSISSETWYELSKNTYAALQTKELHLFHSNGKKFQDVKIDTIPYEVLVVFTHKYPGLFYQRCYKVNKHAYAVLFNKDGNNELAFYPNRNAVIDEEHDYQDNLDMDRDDQDLWWENDRVTDYN
jgi:hypothetical protein